MRIRSLIRLVGIVSLVVGLALAGGGGAVTSADGWPPIKVDLTVQRDGNLVTATVMVANNGNFDTDVLNVNGQVPKGAAYVDSWAGSGRGFNHGVFDGNSVNWINGGVKAGGKQGPFVYLFDISAEGASAPDTILAGVQWAGKIPGTAISDPAKVGAPSALASDTAVVPLTRIDIPPIKGKTTSADILDIDQGAHLLYVTDRTDNGVDVFDVSTPTAKYVRTIDLGTGSNGIVVAKSINKVFTGNNDSTVSVIDIDPASPTVNTVIATINTGGKKRADELDYDPVDQKLYVANSDDGIVTAIDAVKNQIIKRFDGMGEGLEQPRYNPTDGMMYLTSSDQNVIFQFDPTKDELIKKFDVGDPCNPNGIAINPALNQAVLGCSNKKQQHAALWDLKAGKVIATFTQIGAGDAVIYNAKTDRFFFAASNFFRGGAMGILGGSPVSFITNVPTASGSHAVAFDETNNVVYTQDQLPNEGAIFSFPLPK